MQEQEFDQLKKKITGLKERLKYPEAIQAIEANSGSDSFNKEQSTWLTQQQAQCIYQDRERHPGQRLDEALDKLQELNPETTENSETLGIAGAIYKRKYLFTGQSHYIDAALNYYLKGDRYSDKSQDHYDGYNAINAAFLLDLKAFNLAQSTLCLQDHSPQIDDFRQQAEQLRREVIRDITLPSEHINKQHWWSLITLGEAQLALGDSESAKDTFQKLAPLIDQHPNNKNRVPKWQQDSSLRQLAHLPHLLPSLERDDTRKALSVFFEGNDAAFDSIIEGKVGLALSGGGFRAAFYHLGVLARLAETDTLRKVEVLSCVSGGSIIGARYYQLVRHQLSTLAPAVLNANPEGTRALYIDIVKQLRTDLITAVQKNLRSRILGKSDRILKMITDPEYTRTSQLAELYEKHLYSLPTELQHCSEATEELMMINQEYLESGNLTVPDMSAEDKTNCILSNLIIKVPGESNYKPRWDNWKNACKVPILVLNATNLNTGRSWQFTANRMGEAPWSLEPEVNSNDHLHWFRYSEGPGKYSRFSLGTAVAASSCVPGLFHPVSLPDIYSGHTVQLVDGGVFDNQGSAALLDEGCNVVLVSDACGQMETDTDPSPSIAGSALRSSDVIQSRLRVAQYKELRAKEESGIIQKMMFIHHKSGFEPTVWEALSDAPITDDNAESGYAKYKIHPDYLEALSRIRTDLDSFSDLEIDALMYSGYQMTKFDREMLPVNPDDDEEWGFWAITQLANGPEAPRTDILHLLQNGQNMFFKALQSRLVRSYLKPSIGLLIAILVVVLALVLFMIGFSLMDRFTFFVIIGAAIGGYLWYQKRKKKLKPIIRKVRKALLGCLGMVLHIAFKINLKYLDPAFLKSGKRSNLNQDDQ
ncbi:patatin-like phospholipase family protein [Oceanospirillum sediminis]|uniref:Patatin-like phospholipase family protein n=1 Tax=Oceanospirillum sediminis TaxID=2760088 RepID=A0A839IMR8_9GAMM|nr:patatin-like phospholipase family protein [Oceanospirillum sediminis]MBB1486191.1 patatin-like phospholipase family protein [Oceanospirillum sediminis]